MSTTRTNHYLSAIEYAEVAEEQSPNAGTPDFPATCAQVAIAHALIAVVQELQGIRRSLDMLDPDRGR